ncbi:unnamed protein product [Trifolium pratense]|uniref:Uncharacterized protein n=1 Tax=Trifolium pratense TaxID=57577 RepID=A0ACB0K932_TRIPR|nr:unnamed protein product [Trifolium pratense]
MRLMRMERADCLKISESSTLTSWRIPMMILLSCLSSFLKVRQKENLKTRLIMKSGLKMIGALVLESIGDIPDYEVKPPDNVLFVWNLNPVTQDEDLHTIFPCFGTVSWAEIICDHKTGDNLCYAFIVQYVCPQSVLNLSTWILSCSTVYCGCCCIPGPLINHVR